MIPEHKGGSRSLEPENLRIEVDTIAAAKSVILAGLGVQHLPLGEVEAELAGGEFVRVLPQWTLPPLGIYAVWPDIGPQKSLARRLIDFFVIRGGGVGWGEDARPPIIAALPDRATQHASHLHCRVYVKATALA
ncbi:LysR substrate-binding domain-containing protein [Maricaulis salignorans]|uniref:LysR substrate binding domain-containing protein n=1 Tax=Maricaulis salignorans TaxID=144026 RepID=A0A1G9N1G0_9PROT|nr:LysR substrate-binding domain-containing protein [Maricaulis salignorans]SDL80362.1 LysR substrate binding domain-containing protein [Maricaulis salignorans]